MALSMLTVFAVPSRAVPSVLYSENFNSYPNGSQPANWQHDPLWSVQNGAYQFVNPNHGSWAYAAYVGAKFADFNLTVTATGLANCVQQPPVLGVVFRAQNRINNYFVWGDIDKFTINKYVAGSPQGIPSTTLNGSLGPINPLGTYTIQVIANGTDIKATWNHRFTVEAHDATFSAAGYIGVATYNCNAAFDNIVVTSLGSPVSSSTSTSTVASSTSLSSASSTMTSNSTTSVPVITVTVPQPPMTTTTETCQVVVVMSGGKVVSEQIGACN